MYRLATFILAVCLICPLLVCAAAAQDGVLLHIGEQTVSCTGSTLPTPTVPAGKVFAGWYNAQHLLPAGAAIPADAQAFEALFLTMQTCGTWRSGTWQGFRFSTTVDRAGLTLLQSYGALTTSTLILPTTYLRAMGGELTHAALARAGKTASIDLTATEFYAQSDTELTFCGSVVDILPQNQCLEYVGAGYLTVSYTNGTQGRIYAPASAPVGLYATACGSLTDSTPYTAQELAHFRSVLDSTVNLEYYLSMRARPTLLPDVAGYTPPFRAVRYDSASECVILQVRDGVDFRFDRDLHALILDGSALSNPARFYTVSDEGRTLSVLYREYTDNY